MRALIREVTKPDLAALVCELRPQGVGKTPDRELRGAVGRLKRDGAVAQCRADLNNSAPVTRAHVLERRQRPVHLPEVSDLGHAAELVRPNRVNRRKDRRHRVVDPDVNGPEFRFDALRRGLHCGRIGHVGRDCNRIHPELPSLSRGAFQTVFSPCQQRDITPLSRELQRGGSPDTGA